MGLWPTTQGGSWPRFESDVIIKTHGTVISQLMSRQPHTPRARLSRFVRPGHPLEVEDRMRLTLNTDMTIQIYKAYVSLKNAEPEMQTAEGILSLYTEKTAAGKLMVARGSNELVPRFFCGFHTPRNNGVAYP